MEARVGGTIARVLGQRPRGTRPVRARAATCWDGGLTIPVEIATPNRQSASLLVGEAGSLFRTELVETVGSALIVRVQPTSASAGWVFELLALIERWLEACGLPAAQVHHASRTYVITAGAAPDPDWPGGSDPLVAT